MTGVASTTPPHDWFKKLLLALILTSLPFYAKVFPRFVLVTCDRLFQLVHCIAHTSACNTGPRGRIVFRHPLTAARPLLLCVLCDWQVINLVLGNSV